MKKCTKKKSANQKQETRRSREKYPALKPALNLKSRQHLIDYDYLDQLSDKDLKWLNKFSEEFNNASFEPNNRKNIHRGKKRRRDCYNRNNARNRDIYLKSKLVHDLDLERTDDFEESYDFEEFYEIFKEAEDNLED